MSFAVSKLLSLIIYPLNTSLLGMVIGLLLLRGKYQRAGRGLCWASVLWLYLCSTTVFSDFLLSQLEEAYPAKAMSVIPEADAIVLLGGAMRGHVHTGRLPDVNQHADRLIHAVELFKARKASLVVVSGGGADGVRSEAEQIRDLLIIMGVPPGSILLETQSRTTFGNAKFTAELLKARGVQNVLLVTSAYHMRRAAATFAGQQVAATPAPADHKRVIADRGFWAWLPGSGNLSRSSHAVHELVGYQVYRLQGRL